MADLSTKIKMDKLNVSRYQPFLDEGILYRYAFEGAPLPRDKKRPSILPYDPEAENGYFFLFHSGIEVVEKNINPDLAPTGKPIDITQREARKTIMEIIGKLNNTPPFERGEYDDEKSGAHIVYKAHPFESLTVLSHVEKTLAKRGSTSYHMRPLQKLWGNQYASEYVYMPGETVLDTISVQLSHSKASMFEGALRPETSYFLDSSLEKQKERLARAKRLLATLHGEEVSLSAEDEHVLQHKIRARKYDGYFFNDTWPPEEFLEYATECLENEIKIRPAFEAFYEDYHTHASFGYKASGLCEGEWIVDSDMWNVIVCDTPDSEKIPTFTLIDQYEVPGEDMHRRRKHGR